MGLLWRLKKELVGKLKPAPCFTPAQVIVIPDCDTRAPSTPFPDLPFRDLGCSYHCWLR